MVKDRRCRRRRILVAHSVVAVHRVEPILGWRSCHSTLPFGFLWRAGCWTHGSFAGLLVGGFSGVLDPRPIEENRVFFEKVDKLYDPKSVRILLKRGTLNRNHVEILRHRCM